MFKAAEGAVTFCKLRGNPHVELVHWRFQIVNMPDSDVHRILRHFDIDAARLVRDLQVTLERLPRGASTIEDFSEHVPEAVKEGWMYGTLLFGDSQVRTGHLIVGFLNSDLRHKFLAISKELSKIKLETLTDNFLKIVNGSPEDSLRASDGSGLSAGAAPGETSGAIAPAEMGKQEALKRFTVDLTDKARKGEIDPIIGRDEEIRQCVDILMRRRQNNPILTGEAGVGKTAVVEGFVHRILAGDVPPSLREVTVRSLDVGLLQAGASMKGEFENRLRQVIDEVQASPKPIILFIDEAHTLIGAGGAAGTGDAANLLKPALARGTLRTIAATTWAEYKKYIEKDPALTRRFQVVKVEEPTEEKAILMVRGVASILEKHHRVQVLDEALEAAVRKLQAMNDRIVQKTGEPPCPGDRHYVTFDGNLEIALVDAGEGGDDAEFPFGLVNVDGRLPSGLMRAGRAWAEELALQALCPLDQRARFRPHEGARIAPGHPTAVRIWIKAKSARELVAQGQVLVRCNGERELRGSGIRQRRCSLLASLFFAFGLAPRLGAEGRGHVDGHQLAAAVFLGRGEAAWARRPLHSLRLRNPTLRGFAEFPSRRAWAILIAIPTQRPLLWARPAANVAVRKGGFHADERIFQSRRQLAAASPSGIEPSSKVPDARPAEPGRTRREHPLQPRPGNLQPITSR
jgi:hypothetical protein